MSSFPHYLQQEAVDCGPCSLRMIAKYYGKEYSAEMLRNHSYISREGVSMLGISDAAEYIGFKTMGMKLSFEQLANEAKLPCILHWNQNHFVVCYKINKLKNGKYKIYISDPATQRICLNKQEFLHSWISIKSNNQERGLVLLVEPGIDFGKREEENKTGNKHLLYYLNYLSPYKSQIIQLFIGVIVGCILQLIFPFLTQLIVDTGIQNKNLDFVTLILCIQLGLFLMQVLVGYIRSWIMLHVNSRINISLISDFLIKIMNMPIHFFDSKRIGDIMQRIEDHGRIKSFLLGNSLNIVFSLINFFVFSGILAYYNMKILCIFIFGNTIYVLWFLYFMKYRRELDIKRFYQSSTEQNKMIQLIQGMQDIKLNNCEKPKRWEWERIQIKLFRISLKGLTIGQIQQSGSLFFSQTTNIIISFIAAKSVIDNQMTLGMMMSLTYIIGQISAPINDFINFAHSFQDAKISLERLNEIHAQKDEEENITTKIKTLPKEKKIEIENLTFSYSGANRDYALENINLIIPEKKITAIVGESGSGKTTLIKLLQGFYTPNKGSIKIGNINLSSINPHLWRSKTGSVMQESYIFSDTIAKNIALDNEEIDLDRLYNASIMANADEFISTFPLGYDTKIGMEGNGISQGQRQRILIARAIYKNPEYIFLDEATNALDATNESIIMNNLYEFYKGRTVIIAAHRLSTVMNADQIVVMKKGRIVEIGNHDNLIKAKGEYYTLIKNQLQICN